MSNSKSSKASFHKNNTQGGSWHSKSPPTSRRSRVIEKQKIKDAKTPIPQRWIKQKELREFLEDQYDLF